MTRKLVCCIAVLVMSACSSTPPDNDGGIGGGTGGGSGGGSGGGTGGGSGGGGGGTGGGAGTLDSFCASATPAICDYATRCGFYQTTTGCLDFLGRTLEDQGYDVCSVGRRAIPDGRQGFDSTSAATCVSQYPSATCGTVPAACNQVFTPKVMSGGSCFNNSECVAGTYCNTRMACPGACEARKPAGSVVQSASECLEGLVTRLEQVTDGGFGIQTVCVTPSAAGGQCDPTFQTTCAAGLKCSATTRTCVTAKTAGQPCGYLDAGILSRSINDCADGLVCQPNGAGVEVCGAYAGTGERCGQCKYDLRCAISDGGTTGTCAAKGQLAEGCRFSTDCARGLYCKPSGTLPLGPGTCQTRLSAGATCSQDADCVPGLACESRQPADGGLFPERRCAATDAGIGLGCVDQTP